MPSPGCAKPRNISAFLNLLKRFKSNKNSSFPRTMAEPPAKRAKRTGSSAMWERNASQPADSPQDRRPINGNTESRGNRDRNHGREDRRHRSRSRDKRRERSRSKERAGQKRERSYSKERDGRRHRNADRNGGHDRRDKERSRSRNKHRARRGGMISSSF